ncbi:MAG: hypothetical protein M1829_005135 [Trizodia sp. TS-e1964]|nr:MAG: hypothetical protein M1829_005135 [Trizodia sp. TS-e1964]
MSTTAAAPLPPQTPTVNMPLQMDTYITSEPAELDGSPVELVSSTSLRAGGLPNGVRKVRRGSSADPGVDVEEYEELSGEKGIGQVQREAWVQERAKLQAKKSKDPAVMVNIPKSPAAQDYEVAAHHAERPEGVEELEIRDDEEGQEGGEREKGTAAGIAPAQGLAASS